MDKESTFKITKVKELGIPVGYYPLLYFNDLANRQNAFLKEHICVVKTNIKTKVHFVALKSLLVCPLKFIFCQFVKFEYF